jgi:hypothetical protein
MGASSALRDPGNRHFSLAAAAAASTNEGLSIT